MGKRHNLNPVTTLWHANVDKQACDRQMPCKGRNLPIAPAQIRWPWYPQGPQVSTSLLEIAKPLFLYPPNFLTERISTFRKIASSLSYLLLQLGSNDGEASLPEKATSCPKGGDMWRHWYGLTQAWGSTTYGMGLWGRSYLGVGRRAASRAWQSALSKGRHGFTERETLPWKNTHMGLPAGNQAIWTPSPV